MIVAELIMTSTLNEMFHRYSEQIMGVNTASLLQGGRRPKSKHAYLLAYLKGFHNPDSDISDVKTLIGMFHFGMLCGGQEFDMHEVTTWPHGLRTLTSEITRKGMAGCIFTGDGEQWATALKNAGQWESNSVREWGMVCYRQFAKFDLDALIGKMKLGKFDGIDGYLLDN